MKTSVLIVLVFLVALSAAAPDRHRRATQAPKVCHKGDTFKNGRCWKPCGAGWSAQHNNWFRCQKNCAAGDNSVKGVCHTTRCVKGYHKAAGKCYADACPKGYVALDSTQCQRPCPKPYVAKGRKCVNTGAKPGQCDSYTRPSVKRASRPFITYGQRTRPRSSYLPACPGGWDMAAPGRTCYGPCKKGYRKVGVWCKNDRCFNKDRKYTRAGPVNPTVCSKGYTLKNVRCWKNCGAGYSRQWNNWFRCQKNCAAGETHTKGVCYTKRCVNGYHSAGGKCYANACPKGYVSKSSTQCWRPCPKPYAAKGSKCVNAGAKPGQCDSYTRPTVNRASRPFITYRAPTVPRANVYPRCPAGWRMESNKCRKLCKAGYTIRGNECELTICVGI